MTLHHYRNHSFLALNIHHPMVIIQGPNGIGKTNILEPLSLLIPGKGLRKASIKDISHYQDPKPWAVRLAFDDGQTIGLGVNEEGKRLLKLNEAFISSFAPIQECFSVFWLTPEHDRLFLSPPATRRGFLDRLCYSFYPRHLYTLVEYERATRQRQILLQENNDVSWLDALEMTIANLGIAVASTRSSILTLLKDCQTDEPVVFDINHHATSWLGITQEAYAKMLATNREMDRRRGMTTFGPHRDDWQMILRPQDLVASHCSTGEQKLLLLALIMAYIRAITQQEGRIFIVLFDDIMAHLDVHRCAQMMSILHQITQDISIKSKVQLWITSAKVLPYDPVMLKDIQIVTLEEGL